MFRFSSGNTVLQIVGLGAAVGGATLIATLQKSKPTSKLKKLNRVNSIVVDKSKLSGSGIGGTTFVADVSVSRVGINSTAPAYTLDVDGVINSSTDVRINGVSVSGGISADDATALAIALG